MFTGFKLLPALLVLPSALGVALNAARADQCTPKPFTVTNFVRTTTINGPTSIFFDLSSLNVGTTPDTGCSTTVSPPLLEEFGTCDDGTFFQFIGGNLTVTAQRVCDGNHDALFATGAVPLKCTPGKDGQSCNQVGKVLLFVQATIQA